MIEYPARSRPARGPDAEPAADQPENPHPGIEPVAELEHLGGEHLAEQGCGKGREEPGQYPEGHELRQQAEPEAGAIGAQGPRHGSLVSTLVSVE